ncbi:hypothetical protein [Arthrobacter sp. D1-17]
MANQYGRSHQQPVADGCTRPVDHYYVEVADGARQDGTTYHELTDNHGTDNDGTDNHGTDNDLPHANASRNNNASACGHSNASARGHNNASTIGDATSYGHARADARSRGAYGARA